MRSGPVTSEDGGKLGSGIWISESSASPDCPTGVVGRTADGAIAAASLVDEFDELGLNEPVLLPDSIDEAKGVSCLSPRSSMLSSGTSVVGVVPRGVGSATSGMVSGVSSDLASACGDLD